MSTPRILRIAALLLSLGACRRDAPRAAHAAGAATSHDSIAAPAAVAERPPVHVDSFVPLPEALRRFKRDSAPDRVTRLDPSAPSRDSLLRVFAGALERRDSVTLAAYALDAGEFAWLYYEDSPLVKPPYELDPQMMWYQVSEQSAKGRTRLLARLGGERIDPSRYRCGTPRRQGPSRIWEGCVVEAREGGVLRQRRLFGSIVEREGRFKFVGYANDF